MALNFHFHAFVFNIFSDFNRGVANFFGKKRRGKGCLLGTGECDEKSLNFLTKMTGILTICLKHKDMKKKKNAKFHVLTYRWYRMFSCCYSVCRKIYSNHEV